MRSEDMSDSVFRLEINFRSLAGLIHKAMNGARMIRLTVLTLLTPANLINDVNKVNEVNEVNEVRIAGTPMNYSGK
jgi:hypothetical protein